MRIKWLLLFSPFIITSSIAQKTTLLKDVLHYGGISVPASILKTPLSEPAEFKVLQVGTDSVFRGGKPLTGSELSLFKFYLCPTDFLPLKMEWQRTILAFFAKHLKSDDRWWVEMYKPTALEK